MYVFFALTLFVSATLLFAVQPMFAKMVLPRLGGSPSVWNTCMVFYQAALLGGYVYSHLSLKWLGPRRQAVFHLVLMALPWLTLPIAVQASWSPSWGGPSAGLLALLALSVGLPFFVVSTSAPMLQAWFAETGGVNAKDPYFLYAASNLGSLVSLLAYPLVLEPRLTLARQSLAWTIGYALLTALVAGCAVLLWRSKGQGEMTKATDTAASELAQESRPTARLRLRWLALSFVPSSLLLGVTTHISTDLAAVPLLWIIPLALYLLTFVLVFAQRQWLSHRWMLRLQVYLVLLLAAVFFQTVQQWLLLVSLHLAAFFVTTMVCHGELARTRPQARYLTEFYLWMSVGGVLGGTFNALVAPLLFRLPVEYPLVLVAGCLLRPRSDATAPRWREVVILALAILAVEAVLFWLQSDDMTSRQTRVLVYLSMAALGAFLLQRMPSCFGVGIAAVFLVGALSSNKYAHLCHIERSFFGVLQVKDDPIRGVRMLVHGSTNHGMQRLDPKRRNEPISYYEASGPIAQVMAVLAGPGQSKKIGVIGLGTGTLAAFGHKGQEFTYFEIDPGVVRIAENPEYFTFLRDTQAKVRIVVGDARLTLADQPEGQFDLLILDAFSSDAIPLHLLTREAIALYLRKLKPEGVLALHISNRYLELEPMLGCLAADAGLVCRVSRDTKEDPKLKGIKLASVWGIMARRADSFGKLATDPRWNPAAAAPAADLWTDDYSNILTVLRWRRP